MEKSNKTFFASFNSKPFSLIAKTIGAVCNLNCTYCYYLEKKHIYSGTTNFKMSDEILEKFVMQYIQSQDVPLVSFVWQGGEPCLMGIDFYKKATAFQKKYANGKNIENAFQTNGILLNEEWCRFFSENQFLVGISIDGPEHLHNKYRKDYANGPTFHKVMKAIELLKKYKVEFNTLTTVNSFNVDFPLEIYRFLKSIGSHYMQFLPVVERESVEIQDTGLKLVPDVFKDEAKVTEWSVNPLKYGIFMSSIFDEWILNDVGNYYVQLFDSALANWVGVQPGLCFFAPVCGNAGAIEHNGDVYSCDHFVFPEYYLGNMNDTHLNDLMNSTRQQIFGQKKYSMLPEYCLKCSFLTKCFGECPKKRFLKTPGGEYGLNYLCEGYQYFFSHVTPAMDFMANELKNERPPANVMKLAKSGKFKKS